MVGRVVQGDASEEKTLRQLDLDPADVLVAVTDDDELNLRACHLARERHGLTRTIARDNQPENTARFEAAGVVPLELCTTLAVAAESLVLRPTLMNLMSDRTGEVFAFEIELTNPLHVGRRVRDLSLLGDVLVVVIRRGAQHLIPHGDTKLEQGDAIVLIGTAGDEARLREGLLR
jgi:Trk K+ transport system NAD-binding subunit